MSPRLLRSGKVFTTINTIESNANNSYVSIIDDLEMSDDDSLKSQSVIITDLQDKLAIADYELKALQESVDAYKQREKDHLYRIEMLQIKHDGLSVINLELKFLLEKMTTMKPVQVACSSASTQSTPTPGVLVQGVCAAASNDTEDVLGADELVMIQANGKDESAVQSVPMDDGVRDIPRIAAARRTKADNGPVSGARTRVLLLADDHGRGAARIIQDQMGSSCEVLSIFKPGATMEEVLEDVGRLCAGFSYGDYVVVMAGLNNVLRNVAPNFKVINRRLMQARRTNIILATIPYCSRDAELNTSIYSYNSMFYNYITSNIKKSFLYLDVNTVIRSNDIVRNSIHLNKNGIYKLYKCVCSNMQAFKPNINSFVNFNNLIELQTENSLQNCECPNVLENFRSEFVQLHVN